MFDRQAKPAFVVLCIVLLMCGVGFRAAIGYLNITLQKEPVPLREHFGNLPRTLGTWRAVGEDEVMDAASVEALGTNQYLNRTFVREADGRVQALQLHLAYYTGMIDAVPHVPDRCMVAGGFDQRSLPSNLELAVDDSKWHRDPSTVNTRTGEAYPTMVFAHPITGRPVRVHLPLGRYQMRTTEFADRKQPDVPVFAGYFFIANAVMTPEPWGVKKLAFDPHEHSAYYCKVQITTPGDVNMNQERFLDLAADFITALMPRLMQCLPDWPEVESRDQKPTIE